MELHTCSSCSHALLESHDIAMQGLQDAIGLSVTHSTWQRTKPGTEDEHCGWAFASPGDAPLHSSTGKCSEHSALQRLVSTDCCCSIQKVHTYGHMMPCAGYGSRPWCEHERLCMKACIAVSSCLGHTPWWTYQALMLACVTVSKLLTQSQQHPDSIRSCAC